MRQPVSELLHCEADLMVTSEAKPAGGCLRAGGAVPGWRLGCAEMARALPRGRAFLADQLRRAASSIALSIAEGAGEFAAADKALLPIRASLRDRIRHHR